MPAANYIWDIVSDNVLMEKDDEAETIARYVQEPELYGQVISQERDGETRYYNFDGEGSTCELTDDDEDVTDSYEYSAFGSILARTGTTETPWRYRGALGYYTNAESNDIYVRARTYEPRVGRWDSSDELGFIEGPNRYVYVLNSPVEFADPSGYIRVTAAETSCPGCGMAAVYWTFKEVTAKEWFIVQRVCTTLTVQECTKDGESCCKPQEPKTCSQCIYERILMNDIGGHDLWRLPWYIPAGDCGRIGSGLVVSEIRTFSGTVGQGNKDKWEGPTTLPFCDFTDGLNVGTHRVDAPSYWGNSTARYASFMFAGWNCCDKAKTIGFMVYGTSGSGTDFKKCGDGSKPSRPGERIPW